MSETIDVERRTASTSTIPAELPEDEAKNISSKSNVIAQTQTPTENDIDNDNTDSGSTQTENCTTKTIISTPSFDNEVGENSFNQNNKILEQVCIAPAPDPITQNNRFDQNNKILEKICSITQSDCVIQKNRSDQNINTDESVVQCYRGTSDIGINTTKSYTSNSGIMDMVEYSFNNNTSVGCSSTSVSEKPEFVCSLYVTACPTIPRSGEEKRLPVRPIDLETAILTINPIGSFKVSETKCGLIATFTHEIDADNLLLNLNLAQALHRPVQVARFSRRDSRYKQIATLRDIPWSIPIQDICTALTFQGISYENVDRFRNNIRVEVLDANHYEHLICQGLNFFDAARFLAVPERWYRNHNLNSHLSVGHVETDSVLQCYRCQGFWHVAANCRHLPRCVRCGEPHGVEFCPRPRNNPICCHCSGAHHAAYKNCPVRMQLINAIPVSMSLSTSRSVPHSSREIRSRCRF